MPCDKFKLDDINSEFLRQLTEVYAQQVYDNTKNADNLQNWMEGKKLVAFEIVDCYIQNCLTTAQCLPLPDCCHEYLKELSIQDAKKIKAYFIWERRGGEKEPGNFHESDYSTACNEIMPFCDIASEKATSCKYMSDVLFKLEKRKNYDRRLTNNSTTEIIINTRTNVDRRKNGRMNIIDEFLRRNSWSASQNMICSESL